ncbi:hypothetical protein IHE44_0014269 [Lamprotornis superbus]|uniref:BPTI/Kunitz inhibitor domain-containing protein n=1 Tax=Lamprotornis superbus TaxID=245042 RepID=A0A835NNZ4_9PASS|nr:hypothetical protein IHE44_0014269 [Lamprotornis superbus]
MINEELKSAGIENLAINLKLHECHTLMSILRLVGISLLSFSFLLHRKSKRENFSSTFKKNGVVKWEHLGEKLPNVGHKPPPIPSLCMTPMDRGLCRAKELRFFYNYSTGRCRPFSYSGCGGNENNFISRKSCLRICKKGFNKKKGERRLIKIKKKRKKQPVFLHALGVESNLLQLLWRGNAECCEISPMLYDNSHQAEAILQRFDEFPDII